jgi:ABC-type transporter Mla subunit MlaD
MAIPIATTVGGAMWGAFEFYKDYTDMKAKIQKYVAPDLSEFDKRLAVIEENSAKTTDYTRDIKNDLKQDLRRLEQVVETVERSTKQSQRETDQDVRALRKEIDSKIQKALDNPLVGK